MPNAAAPERYGAVSQTLHWLIAVLAFALLAMGNFFDIDPEKPEGWLFAWHTATGLTVLGLMVLRLGWRLSHTVPSMPSGTPVWQARVAKATHFSFYFLLMVLPLSGWMVTSAAGDTVTLFGLFDVPALPVPRGEESEDFLEEVHEILGNVLLGLAGLHVLAGLKHHFIDKDNVLRRMLPSMR